jgi:hypothetical protein
LGEHWAVAHTRPVIAPRLSVFDVLRWVHDRPPDLDGEPGVTLLQLNCIYAPVCDTC